MAEAALEYTSQTSEQAISYLDSDIVMKMPTKVVL